FARVVYVFIYLYLHDALPILGVYSSISEANGVGLNVFVEGASKLANSLFIPHDVATTIVSVVVVSFAATSLDTAVRLMRYIIAELGMEYNAPVLAKKHVATSIAVVSS